MISLGKVKSNILDIKLNFNEHIPYQLDKINKTTCLMYPLINRNSDLSTDNKKLIIKAIFHPIMFYCCPVWSNSAKCHINKLQIALNKLLKMIFRLPWHYSTRRLHIIANMEHFNEKLSRLTVNFIRKCELSQHSHINEISSS